MAGRHQAPQPELAARLRDLPFVHLKQRISIWMQRFQAQCFSLQLDHRSSAGIPSARTCRPGNARDSFDHPLLIGWTLCSLSRPWISRFSRWTRRWPICAVLLVCLVWFCSMHPVIGAGVSLVTVHFYDSIRLARWPPMHGTRPWNPPTGGLASGCLEA